MAFVPVMILTDIIGFSLCRAAIAGTAIIAAMWSYFMKI